MQKDIWTEILGLPLSDNQSDLADALKPNLCQRPFNHDFHTLDDILFYCCPLWIDDPRYLVPVVELGKNELGCHFPKFSMQTEYSF